MSKKKKDDLVDNTVKASQVMVNYIAIFERRARKKFQWVIMEERLPKGEMRAKVMPIGLWRRGQKRILPLGQWESRNKLKGQKY